MTRPSIFPFEDSVSRVIKDIDTLRCHQDAHAAGVPNLRGLRAQFLNFSGSVKKRKASHTDGTSFAVITEDVRFYIRIKGNPGMKECQIRFGFLM